MEAIPNMFGRGSSEGASQANKLLQSLSQGCVKVLFRHSPASPNALRHRGQYSEPRRAGAQSQKKTDDPSRTFSMTVEKDNELQNIVRQKSVKGQFVE